MREIPLKAKLISFAHFLLLCYYMTAGRIVRELWWTNQKFYPVDIISPWFCMLTRFDKKYGEWGSSARGSGGTAKLRVIK
jgi:hypothetical protein